MIREIIHDPLFLSLPSKPATPEDLETAADLADTLKAHGGECVGMAANMIGKQKRIIVFEEKGKITVMFNPEIIAKSEKYTAQEGCLSLEGGPRSTVRYKKIKVRWQTADFRLRIKNFTDFTAQIIQHEIDHINGILI